ncbi:MAG: XRE family transcriptional regulator [Desulfomonilaceae bacterium]
MDEKKYSSDALRWMYNEFIGNDPERIASYQEERIKAEIARQIYDIREQVALTQKQLADLVGTTETVIDDLEEADYEGDALLMLIRIATALKKKVDVQFVTSNVSDPAETSA